MRLLWTRSARADLKAISSYIAFRNPQAANRIVEEIDSTARLLLEFLDLGRMSSKGNCRLLQVSGRPFLLPYRILGDAITILAVFDERQERPDQWT